MKEYIATFWRGNPQCKNGGYFTTRRITAKTLAAARKEARRMEPCVYGTMTLIDIKEAED